MKGIDKFEVGIAKGYRLTVRYSRQILELRRVGTHDLLKHEAWGRTAPTQQES